MNLGGGSGLGGTRSGGSFGLSPLDLAMVRLLAESLAGRVVVPQCEWRGLSVWSVESSLEPEAIDSFEPVRLEDEPLFRYRDGTWGICGRVGVRLVSMTLVEFSRAFCPSG
jgi:hypothetical protein